MDKIIWLHNRQVLYTGVSHDKVQDSVTHTHGLTSKDKGKTKNKRMPPSGAGMSNIGVQRIVNDHTHTWYRVRAMHENGSGSHRVLACQQPHVTIYVLLHPSRTWGSSKDGQGCHHLPPTPRPWKGHAITRPYIPGHLARVYSDHPSPPWSSTLRINR
jgi:hypothetical protein